MSQIQYANIARQAQQLFAQRNHVDARAACDHLLRLNRKSPEAQMLLAEMDWAEMNRDQAIRRLEKYVRQCPRDNRAQVMLGDWLRNHGQPRKAAVHLERFLRKSPGHPAALAALCHCYMIAGENERAQALLCPHLGGRDEHYLVARAYTALQYDLKNYDAAIEVASRHVGRPDIDPIKRTELCFGLGQSYEKIEEYEKAFKAYELANSIISNDYDPEESRRRVRRLIDAFSKKTLDRLPRAELDSSSAIFVVCRPRSGSTMVERIIAAHPQVHAAGECSLIPTIAHALQIRTGSTLEFPEVISDLDQEDVNRAAREYLEFTHSLDPTAVRITNKFLGNWMVLGLVELLLPEARIIDLRRDAIDNCLACFSADLGPHHAYSANLRHMGLAFRDAERALQHWKEVLSVPILSVNYEDIVADQEGWTRKIIQFCGLPWHDDCLRFHSAGEQAQLFNAPTLSYNQVRQPIYSSSVGRAEKFAPFLGPLHEGLEEGRRYWQQQRQTAP